MPYPVPQNYPTWSEWGQALLKALGDAPTDLVNGASYEERIEAPLPPTATMGAPAGFSPVWLSDADAQLYLGNDAFDPPTAPDLFQIDTLQLAAAAVETAKIADGAVDFFKIFDGAVGTQKLAELAVTQAKIANLAVGTAQIIDAAVLTAKIADAAILTAKIGDAQIVEAKIANLAVNTAQIANVAITSGKIANLAVGTTHIQNAAITNALIANVIQSASWDGTNGWQIDKTGNIQGTNIIIRQSDGSVAFASGHLVNLASQVTGLLPNAAVNGLGVLALLNSVGFGTAQVTGFGNVAGQNSLAYGSAFLTGFGALAPLNSLSRTGGFLTGFGAISGEDAVAYGSAFLTGFGALAPLSSLSRTGGYLTGFGAVAGSDTLSRTGGFLTDFGSLAGNNTVSLTTEVVNNLPLTQTSGSLDIARTTGFGTLAAVSLLTSGNISTYIQAAAIGSALIANAAIGTAHIDNAAITTALIADAAIVSAKIGSLAVNTLHIANDAVTVPVSTYNSGSIAYVGPGWDTLVTTTITSSGGPVFVLGQFEYNPNFARVFADGQEPQYRLIRNSGAGDVELIAAMNWARTINSIDFVGQTYDYKPTGTNTVMYKDTPSAGTHTYTLQFQPNGGSGSLAARKRIMLLLEVKK